MTSNALFHKVVWKIWLNLLAKFGFLANGSRAFQEKKGTFSFETSFEYFRLFHSSLFSSSLPSAFSAPPFTNFSASSLEHSANTLPSRLRSEPLMMTMPPEMPFSWKKQLDHRFFFFVAKHSLWSETAYKPFRSWHRIVLFSSFLFFSLLDPWHTFSCAQNSTNCS